MDALYELAKHTVVLTTFFVIIELIVMGFIQMAVDIFRLCRKKWKARKHPEETEKE